MQRPCSSRCCAAVGCGISGDRNLRRSSHEKEPRRLKTNGTSIYGHLTQYRTRFRTSGLSYRPTGEEPPLRSELFSADQMEQYGKTLAAAHQLTPRRARDHLLTRLAANESALIGVCKRLTAAVSPNDRITPAGEWLLDNFYLIEEQIGTAKRHLPRGYSRELPRLALGPSTGLPRVYDIALETIAHGDGRVDAESLSRFVAAYQTVTTLNFGELWAIPIMLRLALIENLRRVGVRMAAGRAERDLANTWADQMMETAEAGSQKPDPRHRRHGAIDAADGKRVRGGVCAPFAGTKSRRWPWR